MSPLYPVCKYCSAAIVVGGGILSGNSGGWLGDIQLITGGCSTSIV